MDKNIDFKNLINNINKFGENNEFFKELISLNNSNQLTKEEDFEDFSENQMQCLNITSASEQQINDSNFTFQLLSDQEMETKLTPSLDLKANISKRVNLFTFHNKTQLFANNFCFDKHNKQFKDNIEVRDDIKMEENKEVKDKNQMSDNNEAKDNPQWNNTLGLSPVKRCLIVDNNCGDNSLCLSKSQLSPDFENINDANKDLKDLNGFQFNSFSSNDKQMETESVFGDISFKSLSKCSDLELRPEELKVDVNQTFRSPNSDFEKKSITSYFKQHSEPISSFKSNDNSIAFKTISISGSDLSLMDESFAHVFDEIHSSNNTIDLAQKLIQRKNRKRKSLSIVSLNSSQEMGSENSFTPSLNSTLNSGKDISEGENPINSKSVVTSGLGTMTTVGQSVGQTYSVPNFSNSQSIGLSNGSALNLNQLLFVSPNVLSLTIGCFIDFKLNYLKVKNLSITSFRAEIKLQANVDTLNGLQIEYPKQHINIPAFFDGLLTDHITVTPLKSGSFSICFQIYVSIEGINLPISPMSVICHIKAEEVIIKRPLFSSKCLDFSFNLFEEKTKRETKTIDLFVSNKQIINEIPLKLSLESNKCIAFDSNPGHSDSALYSFRCPDFYTMFLMTKSQYEMRIPIRIQSNGERRTESCLTVSTDSLKSHALAVFRLSASFWPKRELSEPLLQCSETSITLKTNQWKDIHFRNKSKENLIRVSLKCFRNKRTENSIKLSVNQIMVPPLQKMSIALLADKRADIKSDSNTHLLVTFDSGLGQPLKICLPIQMNE